MELFKNKIDLDNGLVYSIRFPDKLIGSKNNCDGYYHCKVFDCYGNKYNTIHDVIYAEGSQLPKHLWGKKEIDHITPVRDGGTDSFSNLRLVSHTENCNNAMTLKYEIDNRKGVPKSEEHKKTISAALKGVKKSYKVWNSKEVYQCTTNDELIKVWKSASETRDGGFTQGCVSACCRGERESYKNFKWYLKEDYEKMLAEQAC